MKELLHSKNSQNLFDKPDRTVFPPAPALPLPINQIRYKWIRSVSPTTTTQADQHVGHFISYSNTAW